ncbi:hypothetical protein C2S52_017801 [Perilla frutescens var. hirtella]|nr:hypothetical protein C2S52_017801 [Perilla frutescens var. hirtella]KAH6811562.1 hypothetical protein C2S51_025324 [Perilla frutescens var. frutescens]
MEYSWCIQHHVLVLSTLLVLVWMNMTSLEALPVDTKVVVRSLSDKPITIHCKSSEDDLGVHTLSNQQSFDWHFKPNIWGSTSFDCDIQTAYGSGYYNVYDDNKDGVCSPNCVWEVSNTGPCLNSNRPGTKFCEQWRKK